MAEPPAPASALQIEAVFPSVLARYYAGLIRQTALAEDRVGLLGGTIHVLRKPVGQLV